MPGSKRWSLTGAWCGVIGPVCFVGGWVIAGARTPGYSALHQQISQLARIGAPYRALMTAAFIAFGLAMIAFARSLSTALDRPSGVRAAITLAGVATLGVALFPLARVSGGPQDAAHATWAVLGYVGTALAPVLAGVVLLRRGKPVVGTACVLVGAASAACLAATAVSSVPGLTQRVGLSIVDLWFVAMAVWVIVSDRPRPAGSTATAVTPARSPRTRRR